MKQPGRVGFWLVCGANTLGVVANVLSLGQSVRAGTSTLGPSVGVAISAVTVWLVITIDAYVTAQRANLAAQARNTTALAEMHEVMLAKVKGAAIEIVGTPDDDEKDERRH